MEMNWNYAQDEAHFQQIWNYRSPGHKIMHTQELWDQRADEWENELKYDAEKSESSRQRVDATAQYLRHRGLLGPNDDVIDIGCGPGRFVAEFAKTCRSATGSDLSGRMLEHGEAFARSCGITNTSYVRADFNQVDLDALGWRKRFDLVFTSITPAIGGIDNLNKLIEMSRGFCFNSCFVNSGDDLIDRFRAEGIGLPPANPYAGHWHWFYALFNLLLLWGYLPETTYYNEQRSETLEATLETAEKLAGRLPISGIADTEEITQNLYDFMRRNADSNGQITRSSTYTYGWILWDTRRRLPR